MCATKVLVMLLLLGLCLKVAAQDEWAKKPYRQWSKDEVSKILTDSPWAKTQTVRINRRGQLRSIAGQTETSPDASTGIPGISGTGVLGGAHDASEYKFTLRLRSSLPIRQAIVRLVQLDAKYDQMSVAEQKAFDAQTKALLECRECADNYVVSVGFGTSNSAGTNLIYEWFAGRTLPSLKRYIYLANERGERRDLAGFIPPKVPGDEAFFLFPRLDGQKEPLLTPTDKKILFRMSDSNPSSVTNFSLDVSKLLVGGKVDF